MMASTGIRSSRSHGSKRMKKLLRRGSVVVEGAIRLVGCAGVGAVGVAIDVPALCGIALAKSPVLLWKGWKQHIVNMEACVQDGSCPRPVCIPITGAMLLLWPARVAASIVSALLYSFGKGLYGAVVAYQEQSIRCGLKHVVAAIAEYDEFTNDEAHLRQGSCLPRPRYHKTSSSSSKSGSSSSSSSGGGGQQQEVVPVQVIGEFQLDKLLDFISSSFCKTHGWRLIEEGMLDASDLEQWLSNKKLNRANCRVVDVELVADTILQFLVHSSGSAGANLLSETSSSSGEEDNFGEPDDGLLYDALKTLERQIREAGLQPKEEEYLERMVLCRDSTAELELQLETMRKAMLQAFGRRIRGIAAFISRDPAFKARYREYVQSLLVIANETRQVEDMISFD